MRFESLKWLFVSICFALTGCVTMKPEQFAGTTPRFRPEEAFLGTSQGHGLFFDRFGVVQARFALSLRGEIVDGDLVLHEELRYDNGEELTRVYRFEKISEHKYKASTDDLVEPAQIDSFGNALRWRYRLRQKIGDSVWTLSFEDWMYLNPDGSILNRAWVSKWGLGVGEVFMVLRRS